MTKKTAKSAGATEFIQRQSINDGSFPFRITSDERELVEAWRCAGDSQKTIVRLILHDLEEEN